MDTTPRIARIIGPIPYVAGSGRTQNLPFGPCLIESAGGTRVEIIWGTRGERSLAMPIDEINTAREQGRLVLLD